MGIIWTLSSGLSRASWRSSCTPGSNEPKGFVLTAILGVVGAMVATWLGQAVGWIGPAKVRGSSGRSSARSSFWSSGASSLAARIERPEHLAAAQLRCRR